MKKVGSGWDVRNVKMTILTAMVVLPTSAGTASPWWRHSTTVDASQSVPRKTTVQLSGTAGGQFTGYYICNGKRTTVFGALPATFSEAGISQCEFRKIRRSDTLVLQVRDGRSYLHFVAPAGTRGLRADTTAGGWNAGTIKR
ncbi:MAG: hypothetical protein JW955_17875 [Sedimentisphaerales bacterium]|nr:hypothetical protein [Sedimentisphaerales bacterium]